MAFDAETFMKRFMSQPSEPSRRGNVNKSGRASRRNAASARWVATGKVSKRTAGSSEYNPTGRYNYVGRAH